MSAKTEKKQRGLIQIYTGDGKGKTTAALGLAMRAAGDGLKVGFIQFFKGEKCGEHAFIASHPSIEMFQLNSTSCFTLPKEQLKADAEQTLALAEEKMLSCKYDMLILDEICLAINGGFLSLQQVLDLLDKKPASLELVCTGRHAPEALIQRADLVTEMRKIKHPFEKGIRARKGIEY